MSEIDWRARFSEIFSAPASAVQARIFTEVYGAEYPADVEPYSFISVSELDRFVNEVNVRPGEVLADVGCGRGGPGLWVASQVDARLVGIDITVPALDACRARADALGLGDIAEYRSGEFEDTDLPAASVHAVMSIDALVFTPDKRAAAVELARIVRPGGRVVLTTWDYHSQPDGRLLQVPDHRPIFTEAGFEVLSYDETDHWRERQNRTRELMLAAVDELAAERGTDPAEIRTHLLENKARFPHVARRVLLVAQRST